MAEKNPYPIIKRLHEETGVGMMYCKRVLKQYDNDYDKALEYLKSEDFKDYLRRSVEVLRRN